MLGGIGRGKRVVQAKPAANAYSVGFERKEEGGRGPAPVVENGVSSGRFNAGFNAGSGFNAGFGGGSSFGRQTSSNDQECFKCGNTGHQPKDCHNSARPAGREGPKRFGGSGFREGSGFGGGSGFRASETEEDEGQSKRGGFGGVSGSGGGFGGLRSSGSFDNSNNREQERGFGGERRTGDRETTSRRERGFGSERRTGDGGDKRDGGEGHDYSNADAESDRKPVVTYVPKETEIDQLFSDHISKGINFDRYQHIQVQVTGLDVPQPEKIQSFDEAGLPSSIMTNISRMEYQVPTPIQKAAIPGIMNNRDIMACAQTGSGKTAAFILPILEWIMKNKENLDRPNTYEPYAVIVAPTRELAVQIYNESQKFAHGTNVKPAVVYGQVAVRYQREKLREGCDILVATIGRLMDFIGKKFISLAKVKFLVLDEADRMLDMGFERDIRNLAEHGEMPKKGERKTLMFSATFPPAIQSMAHQFMSDNFLFITVGVLGGANEDVIQEIVQVGKYQKQDELIKLLNEDLAQAQDPESGKYLKKSLVFVEQKRMADVIGVYLSQSGVTATTIHGDREQCQREEALRELKEGVRPVLVATSVASRGLDIVGVDHVINFDLPNNVDEYVHRIGRTGRVGNPGKATSFYDSTYDAPIAEGLIKILSDAHQVVPGFLEDDAGGGGTNRTSGGADGRSSNSGDGFGNRGGGEKSGGWGSGKGGFGQKDEGGWD